MDKKRICFNASFQMYVAWTVSIKVYPQCNKKLTEWPSHWHWTAVGPPVHRHPSTLPAAHPQALRHYTSLPPLCKTHLLNKPFSLPRHDCYFTKKFIHSHIIYNILKIFSHISKFIRNIKFRKSFSSSKKRRQPLVKTHQFSNIEILVQGILYLFITFHNIFQNIRSKSTNTKWLHDQKITWEGYNYKEDKFDHFGTWGS